MAINLDHVTEQITVTDTATDVDLTLVSKGAGNVNLNSGNGTQFRVGDTFAGGTATNFYKAQGTAGGGVVFVADGASSNIPAYLSSKGASPIIFTTLGLAVEQLRITHTASTVNYVNVTGAATGSGPTISAQGSDTNVNLFVSPKGTGALVVNTAGGYQFIVSNTPSSVNWLGAKGGATGFGPQVSAAGTDTNIPLVLQPKGTGALQAQQTDSTATGGNARGANAVDWQTVRTGGGSQVASGSTSFIGSGRGNTASGQDSFIGGGYQNFATNAQSAIAGGANNQSTAPGSFVGGGFTNYATRDSSTVVGGASNSALGYYNFIGGGASNSGTANAAVTTQSATMNGTTAVTLSGSNASIKVGQLVSGTYLGFPNYVAAVSGTSLTLSQNASGSGTATLSFFTPHGVVVGGGNNQATGSYSFIGGGGDAGTAANRNVASGGWSTVGGGLKNISSGQGSVIGGGYGNTSSGIGSVIVGGGLYGTIENSQFAVNSASGTSSFIGAGFQNFNSGYAGSIVGGYSNTVNSNWGVASGSFATTRSIINSSAFGAYPFGQTSGACQTGLLMIGVQTTNATPAVATSDGSAAASTNQVILPNNSAYFFTGEVVSGVTGGGNTKGWTIEGVIKRGANAASTALVGTPTVTSSYADAGASTWVIAVTADTTNGGLAVTFTGQASTTIRTVAQIRTTEMTY